MVVLIRDVKGRLMPIESRNVQRVFCEDGGPPTIVFRNGTKFQCGDDFATVNAHLDAADDRDLEREL